MEFEEALRRRREAERKMIDSSDFGSYMYSRGFDVPSYGSRFRYRFGDTVGKAVRAILRLFGRASLVLLAANPAAASWERWSLEPQPNKAEFLFGQEPTASAEALEAAAASQPEPAPAPSPSPEPGLEVELSAGGSLIMSGEVGADATPFARIDATAPLPIGHKPEWFPRLAVRLDLSGLPGDTVDVAEIQTYKSLEAEIGVVQRLSQYNEHRLSVYGLGGLGTLLPGEPEARAKAIRWGGLGLELRNTKRGDYLRVGIGGDQRLTGDYKLVTVISGSLRLGAATGTLKGVEVRLAGDAILGLAVAGFERADRDVVRVQLCVSR
jgi:hypothetical protein